MESDCRAYVAYVAGRLVGGEGKLSVFDQERGEFLAMGGMERSRPARRTGSARKCGRTRDPEGCNYCLVDEARGEHICLDLYGRLFEGYDHGTASHFNGIVDGDEVTLYDFAASDFFSYRL